MANPDNNLGRLGARYPRDKSITPDIPKYRGPDLGNPAFEEHHLIPQDTTGADPASSPDTTLHPGQPVTLSSSD